jgi:hypothetical protein
VGGGKRIFRVKTSGPISATLPFFSLEVEVEL